MDQLVDLLMSRSRDAYPSAEIDIIFTDAGTERRKCPFASVIVPREVFFTNTETLDNGKLSWELIMKPVIILFCAVTHRLEKRDNEMNKTSAGRLLRLIVLGFVMVGCRKQEFFRISGKNKNSFLNIK